MSESPSRDELRQAILLRLETFTGRVEWIGGSADLAFADSILEFAEWYAMDKEMKRAHAWRSARD